MEDTASRAIAIVGVGAVLPDAPDAPAFWANLTGGRYSISDVLPDRWDPARYYDPDPRAPDKTYSKIGGWVRAWEWDPIRWKLPIPPRVSDAMDDAQKWAIAASRQALTDYGWPQRPLELERTAVIMGNAMAGEKHYLTALRIAFPEYAQALRDAPSFAALPGDLREAISGELHVRITNAFPDITEDTMPGELGNIIAGRVANLFNLRGPNYVTDAACASAMAAISAAIEGLVEGDYDAVLSGGIDRNMGASTFVKFCKIGALSATGARPYADGADGFVMGEGAAVFLLKRLADAERAGDAIYAVLRGIAGASDGKGKGITAPNPVGQRLAVERAWQNAGLPPATVSLVEGHGTSTRVGDVVEVEGLSAVFGRCGLAPQSVPLGSVKSNLGHLKGAAGAAGLLKVALALHHKQLPPSLNFERPNPAIDFAHSPFAVNTELRDWPAPPCGVRRAGVSAFGFGGTNFHAVLEEYLPARLQGNGRARSYPSVHGGAPSPLAVEGDISSAATERRPPGGALKAPLRGALVLGAASAAELCARLERVHADAAAGHAPTPAPPAAAELGAAHRIAIDYGDPAELADRAAKAHKALAADNAAMWKALRPQGVFRGQGAPAKVAFLYTGQGSQYVNMLAELRRGEPIVAAVFAEADRVMAPLLGQPLSDFIFVDASDPARVARAEDDLRQTAITQPAVLAADAALTQVLAAYGIAPDMVMGHSLGEYGALVAAGALPFADALEAVSARGREMSRVAVDDNGRMAAVFAPLAEIERILAGLDGYVVIANFNSHGQAVVGGASAAVDQAIAAFEAAGHTAVPLPVSHAFHTRIVAPASAPLRSTLERLALRSPAVPIVANVSGAFYPTGGDVVPQMLDILARQVAEPVQFVKGLETLYAAGARVFVEVGPKKALQGFVDDVLGDRSDIVSLFTNHPKLGDVVALNQALCGLYAAGLGAGVEMTAGAAPTSSVPSPMPPAREEQVTSSVGNAASGEETHLQLDHLFADFLERARAIYDNGGARRDAEAVVVTGAAVGLPGTARVFDDANLARLLHGDQFLDVIPSRLRNAILDKHITRLVKRDDGGGSFETIDSPNDVIKLAARAGTLDLTAEFGVPAERVEAYDVDTALAVGAGLDALRDAGIPLVRRYKTTHKGTQLPAGWALPETLRDDTGIIFASAFPGYDAFAAELAAYYADQARRQEIAHLESLRARLANGGNGHALALSEIDRHTAELRAECEAHPYRFDRRFLFRVLSMGHSQFAELIGARGPNTHINSACASTTQAFALAEDWIAAGRCRRVVVIAADDVTSDHMLEWFGAGFLASGAAATDDVVEEAALPFDRRRHGMLLGMGAAAFVIESAATARERAVQPICEVLGAITANSAFHGTRLDVEHICQVMEQLVARAEARSGIERGAIAPQLVFVSHETYTPARGGSAAAEVNALRHVFGAAAEQIVVANTKGFTGHPMGVGIEDFVAVKALETGLVPPVANYREIDPELGRLNLSQGGAYPIHYALRLGAGFGSQISMTLLRWIPTRDGRRRAPLELGYAYRIADPAAWHAWLARVSGQAEARVEVVHRTLRVVDQGATVRPSIEQTSLRASAPGSAERATDLRSAGAPAAAAAPVTPPAAAATVSRSVEAAAPAGDGVRERVLGLVAEKTGYPTDMLDLDLDLEADLGIDTVKQAELFATIREAYGIARDDKLKLRNFPTLNHVLQFVRERRPGGAPAPAAAPSTAPAPPVLSAVEAAAASAIDEVQDRVLALVAEKTGYPTDMLDLDLDLEADLGIDTVKQAELFATIRETYGIARDDKLKLRDFPTLNHVLQFVRERRPGGAPAPAAAPSTAPAPPVLSAVEAAAASAIDEVRDRVLALVAEKTGYPTDMLDLDLDLEADLGIDTVKQAELFATIREAYGIARDDKLKLRDFPTLSHVLQFVRDRRPASAGRTSRSAVPTAPAGEGPVQRPTEGPVLSSAKRPVSSAAQGAAPPDDDVRERVLALVAEKTGYPTDMLDLDLDLEADLGIDTVKQAELFATIREAYGIARDEKLKLRDFPTLQHVIGFVRDRRPGRSMPALAAVSPAAPAAEAAARLSFAAADAVPRRVPIPVLRPPLALCKATGVTLGAGSRVVVMLDTGGVGKALVRRLEKLGVEVLALDGAPSADELRGRLTEWMQAQPVHGVYWLPALDAEGDLRAMDLAGWREALRWRVKLLYTAMRALYEQIAPAGTFLVAATRLGGQHGYDAAGAVAPLGGAVTGFVKTYKRERPDALVKVVDFGETRKTAELADALIDETLRDPGAVEIGYRYETRWTVALQEQPPADGQGGLRLGADSVFVVTGAAGSITAAITSDLAAASGGTFYLLDLVPEPDPADPDLQRYASDRDGLKRDLFERMKARGERATPAAVDKQLAALERQHAALAAIDAVRRAGGVAYYHRVDLRDAAAVAAAIADVRARSARIDVLLHAGGLEISRMLPDKEPAEFDLVFDVKSDGWFNLLHAIGDMPLAATVAFSSIAARFGNGGQADYASANDLLCKCASNFRITRPATRGIAIDWTAWGGIGMATRGSIPKMMELAGIDMLPPAAGVPVIRRELTAGGRRGEILIGQRLGVLLDEWDLQGGLDAAAVEAVPRGPMVGAVLGMTVNGGLTIETTLDPAAQPFLRDHQIDGTPVLPGVMGLEAFTEIAAIAAPGWYLADIEDVEFLAPFKFYRAEPRTVTLNALLRAEGEQIVADCRLSGARQLAGQTAPQVTTHFRARVCLTRTPPTDVHTAAPADRTGAAAESLQVYRVYFHGPAYQVLRRVWRTGDHVVGELAAPLPANHVPAEQPLRIAPRLIELCFQTAGIWEMGTTGRLALPQHIAAVETFALPARDDGQTFAVVTPRNGDGFDAEVVDATGGVLLRLRDYRTVALPDLVAPEKLAPMHEAMRG